MDDFKGASPPRAAARWLKAMVALCVSAALAACGGGGGGGGEARPTACPAWDSTGGSVDTSGVTVTQLGTEKVWVKSMMQTSYLWPADIPEVDANAQVYADSAHPYDALLAYFDALLSPVTGRDRFSYATTAKEADAFYAGDQVIGSGIHWHYDRANDRVQVERVTPGSPASLSGQVHRGDLLLAIDGKSLNEARMDVTQVAFNRWIGALEPTTVCRATLKLHDTTTGATRDVTIDSASHMPRPVPTAKVLSLSATDRVGYLQFDQHILSAEAPLTEAIRTFRSAQVSDVVLDLRYNGGGLLYIANGLAHALTDSARTDGRLFTRLQVGPNHAAVAERDRNTPFVTTSCLPNPAIFQCSTDKPLPTLGLSRVYMLVGQGTCSASEALVNGLRGIGVTVVLVGDTTCGKPFGFMGHRSSGIVYYPIEFQITNDQGVGDYAAGLAPDCVAPDDRWHELGDTREGLLSIALAHRATGHCPLTTSARAAQAGAESLGESGDWPSPAQALRTSPLQDNANARPVWR